MECEPRPKGVLKTMERKAKETQALTKSGSSEEKCLHEEYQRENMEE